MSDAKRMGLRAERAILVQVAPHWDRHEADRTFGELSSLAETTGAIVVGSLRQHLGRPDPRTYLGKGKLEELGQMCRHLEPDVVITDDELSPSQVRALETALDVKVVDRSEVILDIFATHARSKQAQLQVELAQLEYEFPRLKRMWTHLDRTAGGTLGGPAGGGIGVRGPGEKQLEDDRRIVQRRIRDLKRDLADVARRSHSTAATRREQFATVALVGYTNAGKSSLMNALTDAGVSVRDRLFETLDTRTRRWPLGDGRDVLLSDTVGFVRKFPHHLAASFHATLEEAREADLLLHVVDASQHDSEREIATVNDVLREIGCTDRPTIYLLNKCDLVPDSADLALVRKAAGEAVFTSAVTGAGLDELRQFVCRFLDERRREVVVQGALDNGRLFAFLHGHGHVVDESRDGGLVRYTVRIAPHHTGTIAQMGGDVLPDGVPSC